MLRDRGLRQRELRQRELRWRELRWRVNAVTPLVDAGSMVSGSGPV
jgi:hypothetical protein